MKNTFKKIFAVASATVVLGTASIFSMNASGYYYENDITAITTDARNKEIITYKDGKSMMVSVTKAYRMNYVVDSSVENVTNEYLGVTEGLPIRRIDMGDSCLYTVALNTREEMTELFDSASLLYESGKISDAYQVMRIAWCPISYIPEIDAWMTSEIFCGCPLYKYLNNEPQHIIEGDANGDDKLDVRDCAAVAAAIAEGRVDEVSSIADCNIDGKVNVRDAAAIAYQLSHIY